MPFNITIDHAASHSSGHSSLSEEDSSGTGVEVSPPSVTGSHEYHDPYDVGGPWDHLSYPDELKPSDSASRPRTSHYHHAAVTRGRARSTRRHPVRMRGPHEREPLTRPPRRARPAHPVPEPESEDSSEEYIEYPPGPPERRFWPVAPVPPTGYPHSIASGPSYGNYPHGTGPHGTPHLHTPGMPSNQLVQLGPMGHMGPMAHMNQYGGGGPYPYGPGFPGPGHSIPPPYFDSPDHHHSPPPHHLHQQLRNHSEKQRDGESPPPPGFGHGDPHLMNPQFPSAPFVPPDMVPFHPHHGYFHYNQPYAFPRELMPPHFLHAYHPMPSPPLQPPEKEKTPPPPPPPEAPPQPDPKDEAIARLEKLILDERLEREAREAAREAALEKAARDKAAAEERAAAEMKIAEEAAAKATAIAKAEAQLEADRLKAEAKAETERLKIEAELMAAEEAAKARQAAEEAAAIAVAEAAAAATEAANLKAAEAVAAATAAAKKSGEKKKPVKFKDAIGRKFSFPFHLCKTWQGMEELIRQAFLHIDVIGQHVAEGRYDLVGPNGDIILPQVWETVVEPDWAITMHMWPIPEKPKEPDPPPPEIEEVPLDTIIDVKQQPETDAEEIASGEAPPPPPAPKKPRPPPIPGAFTMWMTGARARQVRSLKVEKKPEVIQQHDESCCVM
ncbi:predicted protein [Uncinocarpus reesii 1704]|uniref:Ubiquitin-like domain-containing protein n=1 Tax=Uncinocarpus reesii (strain UAMH 1704) TaxID=336963 RepID=C4JWQ6_UNCRE|nr:uncharacterized protein UREG_06998 [Uncinocarpus reesii 1704]EEP82133.1 predicted protein [Uncinocarpus reesii 1704]